MLIFFIYKYQYVVIKALKFSEFIRRYRALTILLTKYLESHLQRALGCYPQLSWCTCLQIVIPSNFFKLQFFTTLYQSPYTLFDHVSELMAGFSNFGSGGGSEVEICGRSG